MLKMKINNEEVVCDKEFTITKDILTTSSTTLKNCYPKSWEETKDYVNNFYFPKDFSKCIIYDEEKIPGIPGLTAEGTNINLTYDNTLEKEITKISGDTYQYTTTGKNILINNGTTQTINNIKFTKNNDGSITVNGTSNSSKYTTYNIVTRSSGAFKLNAGNYKLSGCTGGSSSTYKLFLNDGSTDKINYNGITNITVKNDNTTFGAFIQIAPNATINTIIYPMLTLSSITDDTYEPYTGLTPSPNPDYPQNIEVVTGKQNIQIIGKNLFDKNNVEVGDGYIRGGDGQFASSDNNKCILTYLPIDINKNYTLTYQSIQRICFYDENKNYLGPITTSTSPISFVPLANSKYIRISGGKANFNLDTIQLEVGNQATEYEEFKEQTYQIDLAEYDNLFTSTLESGGISSIDGQNIDNEDYLRTKTYINVDGTKHYTIEFTKEVTMEVYYYLANNNYIGWEAFGGENKYTFYPENVDKIKIVIRDNTITTDDIMLTEGSDITPSKYIELCKIGEYQDYIYKENNKWYLHKEIGKVVLDETSGFNQLNIQGFTLSASNWASITNNNCLNNSQLRSKYYKNYLDATKMINSNFGIALLYPTVQNLYIQNKSISTVSDFNTWLSTHNTEVYYVLSTPTVIQITDVNLINQLENLPLYEGINNITMINGNLTSSIKIHYNYENPTTIIDTIFSGLVKNTGNISLNPRDPHYCSLQILDFKDLLSTGETLDFVINEKTVQEAIQMVVDEISDYGFQVGIINLDSANEVIGTYSTLNKTAYDVFQYLANITQSKWFTRMIDDNNIAIDFYDIDKLDTKDDIEYTEQYFENNNIVDISYNYSTKDYRNKQIMLSNEVFANIDYNDTIITDGYNKVFTIGNNIGVLKNLSLNGVPMSVGTSDDKDRGIIADFYYTVGGNIIESDSLISAGGEIEFTYTPLVKGRQIIVNDDEINRVGSQINRNGTISRYETRNDSLSAEELQNIGESYIKYKGKAEITLKVKTINNDLYNIGDMVYFQAPLNDLQVQYMVKKKTINVLATTGDIFYTYELSNTYNSENEINYFDNQRAKANGNISSNDYITRNIDIDNNATIIFNNLGIQEITATGDNLLDCALNSPFNN